MTGRRPEAFLAWSLLGWVLAGELLFGATTLPLGTAPDATRLGIRCLFGGGVLALAGGALLASPRHARLPRRWCFALAALPLLVLLQLCPLPVGLLRRIDPGAVALLADVWPGPVHGCGGKELIAASTSGWLPVSIDPVGTWRALFRIASALVAFAAGYTFFGRAGRRVRALAFAVAAFTALEAAYGLYEWRSPTPHVLWRLKTAYLDSASGTLINRNHFAMLLYLGASCTLVVLAARLREADPRGDRGREMMVRALLALTVGLQLAGIVATQSRAGTAVSLVVLAPAVPFLVRRGTGEVRGVAALVLAVLAVPVVVYVGPDLAGRLQELPSEWSGEASRGAVLRLSLPIVARFLATGTGAGSFEWIFPLYRSERIYGRYDYAHNDYLQQLVETGLPGLAAALLPAALFAAAAWKRWRRPDPLPEGWPIWGALAAVAAHEIVDFGLQIPAHAALVGLLAGASLPRASAAPSRRGSILLGAAALALAPMGLLFSVAGWPGAAERIPWPTIPERAYERSVAEFARWSSGEEEPGGSAALCRAIEAAASAQRARPMSARFASQESLLLLTAARSGLFGDEELPRSLEEARRATDLARRLDPWNAWIREKTMVAALELGDLEGAGEDARVAASRSAALARRIVRTLRQTGLPVLVIGEMLRPVPRAMTELIDRLFSEGAKEDLAALVPSDVTPSPDRCAIAHAVRRVLRGVHRLDPRPFLEGCLESARDDPVERDRLRVYLAQEHLRLGDVEAAERALAGADPALGFVRNARLEIADARGDWAAVVRLALALLDEGRGRHDPTREAWLRAKLGKAYAQQGRIGAALRQYERVRRLNPAFPRVDRIVTDLRHGTNPFEAP
ncbi:MAG: hypothetical protein D6718_07410 [Acidobacteria bacterium]|nr:MAG: hypothetical protein D6718_07410 [Acidobacteriota bacterium]